MKSALLIILLLFVCVNTQKWAVLVAGSYTYSNYRHQADVYHAYQILIKNGFSKDKIITFAFDDIAHSIKNPFKGKVFNKPTYKQPGVDVYTGVSIDYKAHDVNPQNFLHVLQGNKSAVAGKGTGRVLQSTASDNVFLYFADHGAPGMISFPSKNLYADSLIQTFSKMNGRYQKLVFYLQACESGSMFTKLANNTKIYALSAANPSQSSWGTYCSPDDVVQGKHIGSCLGDLFSINFLQNTEQSDIFALTLNQQYQRIKTLTTKSHVLQWGDSSFVNDEVAEFLSNKNRINLKRILPTLSGLKKDNEIKPAMLNSRNIKMLTLLQIDKREKTQESYKELMEEIASMHKQDKTFGHLINNLQLSREYDPQILNFACLRATVQFYEQKCGRLTDYGLLYVNYFANACQKYEPSIINQNISC